jgi:hypothetical protein
VATPAVAEIARPLRLGELLAATIRIFGARPWPFLAIGMTEAVGLLAANSLPYLGGLLLLSVLFAACFGLVTRLVAGDDLGSSLARVGQAMPVLLPLGFVVATPFYLGFVAGLVFLVFSAGWLGLTSFSVPAALVEPAEDPGWATRTAQALRRTLLLARTEYVHAAGVAAALVVIYVVLSILLAGLLRGYAENTRLMAQALAQIPLAPFFFIGLSVLYFEQCARALESPGRPRRRR